MCEIQHFMYAKHTAKAKVRFLLDLQFVITTHANTHIIFIIPEHTLQNPQQDHSLLQIHTLIVINTNRHHSCKYHALLDSTN